MPFPAHQTVDRTELYSHWRDVLHHGVADAVRQGDHLFGVQRRLVEPLFHLLLRALGVRGGHVDDRLEVFHFVAQVQNVPAGFDVDLHGRLHLLVEPHRRGQMEHDVDLFLGGEERKGSWLWKVLEDIQGSLHFPPGFPGRRNRCRGSEVCSLRRWLGFCGRTLGRLASFC